MNIDELRSGIEYVLDGEVFNIVLDESRPIAKEHTPVVILYRSSKGTWRQESWVNTTIQDERLIKFLCIDARRLYNRKNLDGSDGEID